MKSFNLDIPLSKSYTDDNGQYLIAFSISTTDKDAYGDIMSENALTSMLEQARGLTINANHQNDLGNVIGPVVDAWLEKKDDTKYLWIQVNVRKEWVSTIKDLVDSGVNLGGSIEGNSIDASYTEDGDLVINDLRLTGAALTTIPANTATLGTATDVVDGCPGSLCLQLSKSLKEDDFLLKKEEKKEEEKDDSNLDDKNLFFKWMESLSEKIDAISSKINSETASKEEETINEDDDMEEKKNSDDSIEKKLHEMEEKNMELEKKLNELKKEKLILENSIAKKDQEKLVKKALKLTKSLDPQTKILNKDSLLAELGSGNVNDQLKSYVTGMELALKKMPEGDLPYTSGQTLEKTANDEIKNRILKRNQKLSMMGKQE